MPSEFLHMYVGLQTLNMLKLLRKDNFSLVVVGSQGPDPFLYMPFDSDVYRWSKLLHNEDNIPLFISHLGEMLRDSFPEFTIAFLSHYILDSIIHPYINARAHNNITHGQLERAIDRAFMDYIGYPPLSFKFSLLLPSSIPYQIDIAIRDSIKDINTNHKYIVGYYNSAYQFMRIFHTVYDAIPAVIQLSAELLGKMGIDHLKQSLRDIPFKDPLNISRHPWKHKGEIHYEDVVKMVKVAIEKSIEKGEAYLKGSPLIP